MNREQLKKNVGFHVRLTPVAQRLDSMGTVLPLDDEWLIQSALEGGIEIRNPRTGHARLLGYDHIYSFTSDSDEGNRKRGILTLRVQLLIQNDEISIRPSTRPGEPVVPIIVSVATRLVQLFACHGVHRNQISRVLGGGLKPRDLVSDEALLHVLTDKILDDASTMFAIRREWLDGAGDQIYPLHDFYKRPTEFQKFISELGKVSSGRVNGVVLAADSEEHEETCLIVLEQEIGSLGSKPICRYHLCNNWIFAYWKARAYLTACVATAWNANVPLMGRRVPIAVIHQYHEGTSFLEYGVDSALPLKGQMWYPEDMAVKPAAFLDGIDEGVRGKREGLSLWLSLCDEGFMKTDLPYANVRRSFTQALEGVRRPSARSPSRRR